MNDYRGMQYAILNDYTWLLIQFMIAQCKQEQANL